MDFISGLKMLFLILLTGSIAYVNYFVAYNPTLIKAMYSVVILLIAYLISIFIDNLIKKQIKETRERYSIRKAASTIISILVFGAILGIWFQETTTLVVAFGLLSAGIAIALQNPLKKKRFRIDKRKTMVPWPYSSPCRPILFLVEILRHIDDHTRI